MDGDDHQNNWGIPHAFHLNLPPNHLDEDGVPHITKFAHKMARMIVDLAMSITLTEAFLYSPRKTELIGLLYSKFHF
jgi:hypothetical protein